MKRQIVLIASLVAGLAAALLTSTYISGKNAEDLHFAPTLTLRATT